jgi:hypothetical protein
MIYPPDSGNGGMPSTQAPFLPEANVPQEEMPNDDEATSNQEPPPTFSSFPPTSTPPSSMPSSMVDENRSPHPSTARPTMEGGPAPNQETCRAIQQQSFPSSAIATDPITFGITVDVQYSVSSSDIIVSSLDSMNVPVALWVAGCEYLALKFVSNENKHRILQVQDSIGTVEYSQVEPWGLDGRYNEWFLCNQSL